MDRGTPAGEDGAGERRHGARPGAQRTGQPQPGDFWTAPRLWPGGTVVCIAGGPSLTAGDVAYCRGRARVIAINDGWRLAPWADVLYACDARWWIQHQGAPSFEGLKVGLQGDLQPLNPCQDVRLLRWRQIEGLETDPAFLATGQNSGYQALNLALHLGARRVVLLGYDCQAAPDGRLHWFGDHPPGLNNPRAPLLASWARHFAALAPLLADAGLTVLNASPETALTCFPRVPLARALEDPPCSP